VNPEVHHFETLNPWNEISTPEEQPTNHHFHQQFDEWNASYNSGYYNSYGNEYGDY